MNLVITISRRFGTGASLIAQELSEKLEVPVYDKAYIEHELDGDSYATEAEVIKELAEHPCIILGRCASEILKDQPNVFNVYVCADKEDRIERIMKKESLPHDEAKEMLCVKEIWKCMGVSPLGTLIVRLPVSVIMIRYISSKDFVELCL